MLSQERERERAEREKRRQEKFENTDMDVDEAIKNEDPQAHAEEEVPSCES